MGRHATDGADGADADGEPTFRWEAVPDEPAADDPRRRRRVRTLVTTCIAGGVVIVVLVVLGVRLLVHDLDERSGTTKAQRIEAKYRSVYDSCRAGGRATTASCADTAARQCVIDPRWTDDDADDLTRVCHFGPRAR